MATDRSMTAFAPFGTRLVVPLGVGSVFEVALVSDEANRELICKRTAPEARGASGDAVLDRERSILLAVRTPYLVELVGFGSDARGGFLLEARARGSSVRRAMGDAGDPLDAATWLALAHSSAEALSALHAARDARGDLLFVHGDISPDNLFFDPPANATFVDFSSATFRDDPDLVFEDDRGTLPYVAPEIARGEARPSRATDVYALAATLLAAAVGAAITDATTEAARLLEVGSRGVRVDRLDRRRDLPESARAALTRALSFDPASRLASFADELRNAVG